MISPLLGRLPGLFLLGAYLFPLVERWLILPVVLILITIGWKSKGRALILISSAILGWSSGISLEKASNKWHDLSQSKGYLPVEVTWQRDTYTSGSEVIEGWASLTPIINESPQRLMAKDARVTLVGQIPEHNLSIKMAGNRWNGKILLEGEEPNFFIDVSFENALPPHLLISLRNNLVQHLEHNWKHLSQESSLPLLRALLTGDRYGLEAYQKLPFARLGLLALLAISGLHLGLIFMTFRWVFKLWFRHSANWLALMVTLIYASLGGWGIALARAFGMCLIAVLAKSISRKYIGWNALFFMAWLELVLQPSHLNSPSFLLTYGGVLGILWSSTLIKHYLPSVPEGKSSHFLRRVAEAYLFSWGAMLFTWPITALYFSSVPTWAWLWAPLFFFTFSLVMTWVFICLLVSLILPLHDVFLLPLDAYLSLLNFLSESGAWVSFQAPGNPIWACPYYLGLLVLLIGVQKNLSSSHHLER